MSKRPGLFTTIKEIFKLWNQIKEAEKSTQIGQKLAQHDLSLKEQYQRFMKVRSSILQQQAATFNQMAKILEDIRTLKDKVHCLLLK